MKKVFLTVVAVAAMATTSAFAQLQFGVKLGANVSNMTVSESNNNKAKLGFNVGVTVDYSFNDQWALYSGLELTQKGYRVNETLPLGLGSYKVRVRPLYLQLPIHIAYKIDLGSVKLVPEAGPYLAFGIAGKIVPDEGDKMDVFGKDSDLKRFDLGLGAAFGAEFGEHFGAKLGYDYGLINIVDGGDVTARNSNFYISVGYKF